MEYFVAQVINHIAQRLVLFIVIDGRDHIIVVPAPIFLPLQIVAQQGPVGLGREVFVYIFQILAVQIHPLDHPRHGHRLWQLGILDGKGNLIRYDLPAEFPVQGDKIGIKEGGNLLFLPHMGDHALDQGPDQPPAHIFRIGGHSRHASHLHNFILYVDLHGIDYDHGSQLIMVKPAQHVGGF